MTKSCKWMLLLIAACGVYVFFQIDKVIENRTNIISRHVEQINQVLE